MKYINRTIANFIILKIRKAKLKFKTIEGIEQEVDSQLDELENLPDDVTAYADEVSQETYIFLLDLIDAIFLDIDRSEIFKLVKKQIKITRGKR